MKRSGGVMVVGGAIALVVLFFGWLVIGRARAGSISIPAGASVNAAAEILTKNKIIFSPLILKIGFKIWSDTAYVYPGEFSVPEKCSARCLVRLLNAPPNKQQRITITEGMDLRDIARLLEKKGVIGSGASGTADFYKYTGWPARFGIDHAAMLEQLEKVNPFLRDLPTGLSLEGYLYPDTYELNANDSLRRLLIDISANFKQKISDDVRTTVTRSGHSLYSVIIMASILEKEVRTDTDRRLVADILWRRLKIGMALQVDASVQYFTGKSDRFTTRVDRAQTSPWNTYKNSGLPPGPIGNPGLAAILAAAQPTPNNYWYYLTALDGRVYYATTLVEHVANKKYLR